MKTTHRPRPPHRQPRPTDCSRRDVLQAGAATAAFLALRRLPAQTATSGGPLDPARFLASYACHGYTQAAYDDIVQNGYQAFLAQQLAPATLPDPVWTALNLPVYNGKPLLDLTAAELLQFQSTPGIGFLGLANFVRAAQALRSVATSHQVLDKWGEYLSQHHIGTFGTDADNAQPALYPPYLAALRSLNGKVRDVLSTAGHAASMLHYLNTDTSDKSAPNENWAREMMELYTIGLQDFATLFPGGTTQYEAAVKTVAKVFTGWRWDMTPTPTFGQFAFDANAHDPATKSLPFLQKTYGAGTPYMGEAEGVDLLTTLAIHPSTAHHFADRLCRWFLADDPPDNLVNRVVLVYNSSGGDIATVLATMFNDSFLSGWKPNENPLFLRSSEFVYWTIRALGIPPSTTVDWVSALIDMGNAPGDHRAPDGYQPGAAAGQDSLLQRWQHAYRLTRAPGNPEAYAGLPFDDTAVSAVFGGLIAPAAIAHQANARLTGGRLSIPEVQLIQRYYNDVTAAGATGTTPVRDVLALTFSAPSAQYLCG